MIQLNAENKIALTGAAGWLGTELLEVLLKQHGSKAVNESVICFGSRKRTTRLSDGTEITIHDLADEFPETDFVGVVHLAFQTRDKVAILGNEKYCYENLKITSRAIELIEISKPNWIATVSSGAVYAYPGGPLENDVVANPYGYVKRIEETMLQKVAEDIDANLSIGRLWGAMGRFMPPNPAYAISDFIMAALRGQEIAVTAKNKVFRRYVDAGEFMDVLTSTAACEKLTFFESGGHLVELGDLANKVAKVLGVSTARRDLDPQLADNIYYPKSDYFETLSAQKNIDLTTLDLLIRGTIEGHKKFSTNPQ